MHAVSAEQMQAVMTHQTTYEIVRSWPSSLPRKTSSAIGGDPRRAVPGRRSPAAGLDGGRLGRVSSLEQTVPEVRPEDDGEGHPDDGQRDVERELMKWEEKAKALTKELGDTFSDTVKVSSVASIMLQAVQELVYQSIGDKLDNDEVTAKIRSVVSKKVAMVEGPTPMDVGKIDHECESENPEDDVVAVSWSTHSLGFGGWGPRRRECPSVANDGKGAKLGQGIWKRTRERAYPQRADRRATAEPRRDPEGEDSRDLASGVASRGTERPSAGTSPRTPSRKRMRRRLLGGVWMVEGPEGVRG